MYTLEEIKAILDSDDAMTLDGYNLIRTNIMSTVSPALEEVAALNGRIKELEVENERLKNANITLYNKVEKQIMKPAEIEKEKEEDEEEIKTPEEVLKENIELYKDSI